MFKRSQFGFQSSLDFCVYGGDLDMQVAVAQKIINEIMNKKIYTNCS